MHCSDNHTAYQANVETHVPSLPTSVDPVQLRRCLSHFATGVAIITYEVDGLPKGVTVNSFTSVSMDPPLVLVAIGRSAKAASGLNASPFVVNVLAADQLDIALHFAGRTQPELIVPWETEASTPWLRGCVARFECAPWRSVEAGDHILFLGRVIDHEEREADALLFHVGQFRSTSLN
jgi:flavin reductase (DIM6/NTAB) family NADH-FMN oxidoreductase RutF